VTAHPLVDRGAPGAVSASGSGPDGCGTAGFPLTAATFRSWRGSEARPAQVPAFNAVDLGL